MDLSFTWKCKNLISLLGTTSDVTPVRSWMVAMGHIVDLAAQEPPTKRLRLSVGEPPAMKLGKDYESFFGHLKQVGIIR